MLCYPLSICSVTDHFGKKQIYVCVNPKLKAPLKEHILLKAFCHKGLLKYKYNDQVM